MLVAAVMAAVSARIEQHLQWLTAAPVLADPGEIIDKVVTSMSSPQAQALNVDWPLTPRSGAMAVITGWLGLRSLTLNGWFLESRLFVSRQCRWLGYQRRAFW